MPEFELATLDMAIIVAFTASIVGIGFWVGRKKENADDFLLAGRGMAWPLVGFSLLAAQFSGSLYIALAGGGYEEGIVVWNFEWMATLVLVVFAILILPFYLQTKITTVPEFLERRYDRRARKTFSAFTVLTGMFIDSAGAMFAGAIVMQLLWPETPLLIHIAIIALLGGGYVILGGLQAVMITDTIQGPVLFLAGGVVFVMAFAQFDFDWSVLQELAPERGWTVVREPGDEFLPWPGLFTGAIWLSFYVWVTNHMVVQKVLSAKNIDHGRWGALFAGLMQLPLLVLVIFPGILGRGVFEELDDPDMAFPALIFEFLPIGIRGFVVAALIAALMSTLDSVLNGASSLVVNDWIKTSNREFSERQLLVISRSLVAVFMVVAALWAPVITTFDTIVEFFQSFLGYVTMPLVVVLLGGIFWKRASSTAAFVTFGGLLPVGVLAFFAVEIFDLAEVQFLYATGIMFAASVIVFVVASLMTDPPPAEQVEETTWSTETWRKESEELAGKPKWKNYRYLAGALFVFTILIVIPFV
ncbi:MAG TPA: sodium/solute symporter [Egibacteraceae bacterium]|nr:sodium/solute symporter [Egibacteraceae bacterium]